jgi:hypothetical protein
MLYGAVVEPPKDIPSQHALQLTDALQWLRQQSARHAQQKGNVWQDILLQPAVAGLLVQLAAYWDSVSTSERLMALHPPPMQLFQSVSSVADSICAQLASDCLKCGEGVHEGEQRNDQPAHATPQEPHQLQPSPQFEHSIEPVPLKGAQSKSDAAGAAALAAGVHDPSTLEDLLDASADLVVGWCGMLGAGAAGRTTSAVHCSIAGLAASVLLCSCSAGARRLVERWGVVLLDDVLTMPRVRPPALPCSTP